MVNIDNVSVHTTSTSTDKKLVKLISKLREQCFNKCVNKISKHLDKHYTPGTSITLGVEITVDEVKK